MARDTPVFVSKMKNWVPEHTSEAVLRSSRPVVLKARAMLGHPVFSEGKVSVIVPVYNVEMFLEECLESLRVQNYPNLEILMINDGSTDGSPEIAERFAASDDRFRLVNKVNGGLGSARNKGIELATGEYITFVDSDDIVPREAYYEMVQALASSGSDFAVGAIERLRNSSQWRDAWVTRVHAKDRLGIRLEDMPETTKDVFATNKLFRTEFFRRVVGRFPENIYYEDQAPTARAFTGAVAFDVLATTTYLWRIREDGSSITQNKLRISDLTDRLAVMREVESIYRDEASSSEYRYWLRKSFAEDLSYYYELGPRGTDDYWELLTEGTQWMRQLLTDEELVEMPAKHRIPALLTAEGRKQILAAYYAAVQTFRSGLPVRKDEHAESGDIDLALLGIPQDVISPQFSRLGLRDREIRVSIQQYEWLDSGTLELQGYVYRQGDPKFLSRGELVFELRGTGGVIKLRSESKGLVAGTPTPPPYDSFETYVEGGFVATLSAHDLLQHTSEGNWTLHVRFTSESEIEEAGLVTLNTQGSGAELSPSVFEGTRVEPVFNGADGFQVRTFKVPLHVEHVEIGEARKVSLTVVPAENLKRLRVRAVNRATGASATTRLRLSGRDADARLRGTLDLPIVEADRASNRPRIWAFSYWTGRTWQSLPTGRLENACYDVVVGGIRVSSPANEAMELSEHRWYFAVDDVQMDSRANSLRLSGPYWAQLEPKLGLLRPNGTLIPLMNVDRDKQAGRATFAVELSHPDGPESFVASGWYGLCGVQDIDKEDYQTDSLPIRSTMTSWSERPVSLSSEAFTVNVTNRGYNASLYLHIGPRIDERWRAFNGRKNLIDAAFRTADMQPIDARKVVASSFNGTNSFDSVRPVVMELQSQDMVDDIVWAVADLSVEVPEGHRKVLQSSPDFVHEFRTAKFLVNNNNFPHFFEKRIGQIYVQLWHGTPLKRIANDVPATSLSYGYRALMEREVAAWDLLIGQSEEATEILARAFGYLGRAVATGYPKNDALARPGALNQLREDVRSELGVLESELCVLYAPTWRDNVKTGSGGYGEVRFLDEERLLAGLNQPAKVLVRGHFNTRHAVSDDGNPAVINVSNFENLNGLMAAADILITDYSSIMFDFTVTRKPIYFLAPDVEDYADTTRGMYFEYSEIVPGGYSRNTEDLVMRLNAQRGSLPDQAVFRERFAALDDGQSAARVVRELRKLVNS